MRPEPTAYLLERALVDGAVHDDVLVEIADGRFTAVTLVRGPVHSSGVALPDQWQIHRPAGESDGAIRVPGLSIPGFANAHSHAFHRSLRGRTQRERGTFWSWRESMYAVAERLDPDSAYDLAHATYREMAAAGVTTVGEFHYLHHQPDGTPYADPNAMGLAHIAAARDAGIRITLLDTCYLAAGIGIPPSGVQVRFDDGDADSWAERVSALEAAAASDHPDGTARVGAAIHSVRAVPRDQLAPVVSWSRRARPARQARPAGAAPLHVHLSEQRAENEACRAAYGVTPGRLLADAGVWGPTTTAVHATHLTPDDIGILGAAGSFVCLCPTTERDLADGIGPARALADAGCRLTLGSDSHAVIDPGEEMRAVETHERLASQQRGHFTPEDLLAAGTATGHASLGFPDAGRIAVGHRADLVTVDLQSPRTAGSGGDVATVVFAATAADVRQVIVDGRVVVTSEDPPEIGRRLTRVLHDLTGVPA